MTRQDYFYCSLLKVLHKLSSEIVLHADRKLIIASDCPPIGEMNETEIISNS